uniref:DAGKc domain-containing protein n=1 Tax=Rhabditophanes sp. KR3021 TaxID=114890 RepID=A0AC35U3Y4_9BILA
MDGHINSSDRTPLTASTTVETLTHDGGQLLENQALPNGTAPEVITSSPLPTNHLTTTVKSTDGKMHEMILNPVTNHLIFKLLNKKGAYTDVIMQLDLKVVLCVRNKRVKIKKGLPVGVEEDTPTAPETPNSLFLYYAHKINVFQYRLREVVCLFPTANEKKAWVQKLSEQLGTISERPKKLVIFVNPFGGKGKAKKIYDSKVFPLFKMAGIECHMIETERANFAYDTISEMADEWKTTDGIIAVGGDGAGSSNSIVSTVHGISDVTTSAVHIAIGSQAMVDVCAIHEGNKLIRLSANAISYGWLGDVLSDSENFRFMGPIRYNWAALRTSCRNRSYTGLIKFKLNENNYEAAPEESTSEIQARTENDAHAAEGTTTLQHTKTRLATTLSVRDNLARLPKCIQPCVMCENDEKDPSYPYHFTSDFSHIIAAVNQVISPFSPYGIAPFAGLNDGSLDLAMVPRISRFKNLNIMRKVAMYGGREVITSVSDLHAFRVSRFSFTPGNVFLPQDSTTGSHPQSAWNVDGEIMPQKIDKEIHFRLHPRLISYFGIGVDVRDPRYRTCFCCHTVQKKSNIIILENDS